MQIAVKKGTRNCKEEPKKVENSFAKTKPELKATNSRLNNAEE